MLLGTSDSVHNTGFNGFPVTILEQPIFYQTVFFLKEYCRGSDCKSVVCIGNRFKENHDLILSWSSIKRKSPWTQSLRSTNFVSYMFILLDILNVALEVHIRFCSLWLTRVFNMQAWHPCQLHGGVSSSPDCKSLVYIYLHYACSLPWVDPMSLTL
jgi:hypothetical protein